jgi:hypothetical protein
MKFALETANVTWAVKYFTVVPYEMGVNYNIIWRKETKRKERKEKGKEKKGKGNEKGKEEERKRKCTKKK